MDLSTLAVIVIVFFVSLFSILFISRFPKGKSFEEMWKEKKEIEKKILATTKKETVVATKKAKKVNKKQEKKEKEKKPPVKESDVDSAEVESDANSADDGPMEEEINPLTYAKRVEYVETESIQLATQSDSKKAEKKEKGKKNKKQGILVNKMEPVNVKQETAVLEANHFEETQPKDVIEIARSHQKEEENKQKSLKEGKKKNKQQQNEVKAVVEAKQTPPISPKNVPVKEVVDAPVTIQMVAETKPSATVQQKEKSNKKKKNEMITKQLAAEIQDDTNVQTFVRILGKADLPRNEIQILIDFLLNKQQDTLTKDPSEWNDPSDPLQKLKKQLQDKDLLLKAEQEAMTAIHAKLKELRTELNSERSQANANVKALNDEINNKKVETKNFQQQVQLLTEKCSALQLQHQQSQQKFMQYSKEQQEQVKQLNESMQMLQQELMNKDQFYVTREEDHLKKLADLEIRLHQQEEMLMQQSQEKANFDGEVQRLTNELSGKEELIKSYSLQTFEIEPLKQQLAELQAKQKQSEVTLAANKDADESSRVELRNLQNALDSTKTELTAYRTELNDTKTKMLNYDGQISELQSKEQDLSKQLEEQKAKNNELTEKSLKHLEEAAMSTSETANDVTKIISEEQNRTKELLLKLLPTDITSFVQLQGENAKESDFYSWLESTISCIKEQQENIRLNNSNDHHLDSSNTQNNHGNNHHGAENGNDEDDGEENEGEAEAVNGGKDHDSEKESLLLHNAQLQATVDEYKTIIADTESLLKNLEAKVREQEKMLLKTVEAVES